MSVLTYCHAAPNLGNAPFGIAFDGTRVWTANSASVSIVTPGAAIPWSSTTVTAGFAAPDGALYDGVNIWITDYVAGTILKVDSGGAILQTVTTGSGAHIPGRGFWVALQGTASIARF